MSLRLHVDDADLLHNGAARTAVLNPITQRPLVDPYQVGCLSYREAMAEKVRAALCRRDVAIRDYFDVDHAVCNAGFDPLEPAFVDLVMRKLKIPRTGPPEVSDARTEQLRRQRDARLLPVLRAPEFEKFDLERAVETVRGVARELARR